MSDHVEEQEMEAEALTAIFDTAFEITSNVQPIKWSVSLYPVDTQDDDERDELNHVGCILKVELPCDYPDVLPMMDIEVIKGLSLEHKEKLLTIANEEAEAYMGMPGIYSVCEAVRTWLGDNNVEGLDDVSMHAQMLRNQVEDERNKAQAQQAFESQNVVEEMSQAEREEIEVRKRRAEGTPCNKENFEAWKAVFDAEMAQKREEESNDGVSKDNTNSKKKKSKSNTLSIEELQAGRLTGYVQFTDKKGLMNFDLLEKAAEEAAAASGDEEDVDVEDLDVDEDLFDDDDDLDDLDFDDDDDDSDDEIDI